MTLTYEQIIESIVVESGMTKVAFLKLTIEQRVYLVDMHLGNETANLYETLNQQQVVELASEITQGSFSYKFKYITESTNLFKDISTLLNTTLYGIYNTRTRYFMLTETFSSLMKHLDKHNLVAGVLSGIASEDVSTTVSVPSIGNSSVSVSALEIKEMLDRFTKAMYDTHKPSMDIIVESLLLSLLDVNFETEAVRILNNYSENLVAGAGLGKNITNPELIAVSDNIDIGSDGLSFTFTDGKSSEIRRYRTVESEWFVQDTGYMVEVVISKYESGSLQIFWMGSHCIYNDTPTKGTLSFSVEPGASLQTVLAIQSEDFKGTISNISIRKLITG